MTLNRWKVLACTLTVGVGGLAVFATPPSADKTEAPREPAPLPTLTVKPASPANGTDTPAPVGQAKAEEFELVVPDPVVTPTVASEPARKPASEPVFEPLIPQAPVIVPVRATDVKDPPKPEADKSADVLIPLPATPERKEAPKPVTAVPDVPKVEGSKPPVIDLVPPPVKVEAPPPAISTPPAQPARPEPTPPMIPSVKSGLSSPADPFEPTRANPPPAPVTTSSPATIIPAGPSPIRADAAPPGRLKMLLRVGDGQPRFEIRNSGTAELLLKVYGEKIEMQAPPDAKSSLAGVTALGRVRFTAPGIEGTCDHLAILSGTGEVLLKGNIHLKSKRGKAWSDMTAEKMVYQIGTAGLFASAGRTPVTPASYIPD